MLISQIVEADGTLKWLKVLLPELRDRLLSDKATAQIAVVKIDKFETSASWGAERNGEDCLHVIIQNTQVDAAEAIWKVVYQFVQDKNSSLDLIGLKLAVSRTHRDIRMWLQEL